MLTGASYDPQLREAYRLLIIKVYMYLCNNEIIFTCQLKRHNQEWLFLSVSVNVSIENLIWLVLRFWFISIFIPVYRNNHLTNELLITGVPHRECDQLGHQEDVRWSWVLPRRGQEGSTLQNQQGLLCLRWRSGLLPGVLIHGCGRAATGMCIHIRYACVLIIAFYDHTNCGVEGVNV